ncbi:MAG TPA: type II secretion system protein [Baekduia sp.]|nr:type II secretion system protein [Baekduia sp.]
MLQRFKNEDEGFTLIELLVVILIIGILAAIALPSFLGQQKKGQDSSAKSDARNAVSQIESCYVDTQAYADCVDLQALDAGLPDTVTAATNASGGYTVTSTSASDNVFTIDKDGATGVSTRSCTDNANGKGSCVNSTW